MRVSTGKWIAQGFEYYERLKPIDGLIADNHVMAIVPKSNAANTDAMITVGWGFNKQANDKFYDMTTNCLGSINAKDLNQLIKDKTPLKFGDTILSTFELKRVTKNYRRATDKWIIHSNEAKQPARLTTPCGDWDVFIAPMMDVYGVPVGLDAADGDE